MAKVKGIGGVFFKSHDPAKLQAWYREHLGFEPEEGGEQAPGVEGTKKVVFAI